MEKKRTQFVKTEVKADSDESNQLAPYTNECTLSVRIGSKPETKQLNGYTLVQCSVYHWQPKGRPQVPMTAMIYDATLQERTLQLRIGQSLVMSGKLGYDVHQNGIVKLFLLVDTIS